MSAKIEKLILWSLLLLPLLIAVYQGYHPPHSTEYPADFAIFRTAAEMIRSGAAANMYDLDAQKEFYFKIVGPSFSQFLVWNHPPAEALIYFPFGFATYEKGLFLTKALNSLWLCTIVIWSGYRLRHWPDALFLLGMTFFLFLRPASGTIATGQDTLWILSILLLALQSLREQSYTLPVLLLGIASVKFTIFIPLLFVLLLVGYRSFVLDAILAALLVWLVPVILFGPAVYTSYIRLCIDLVFIDGQMGMHSDLLWNFRRILLFLSTDPRIVLSASILCGLATAFVVRTLSVRYAVPCALLIATFFSFHVYQHDALMYAGSIILFLAAYYAQPDFGIENRNIM